MIQSKSIESRRSFLKRASIATLAIPLIVGCKDISAETGSDELSLIKANANRAADANWCGAKDAPNNVFWRTTIPKKSSNDEPMIISGTVYQPDGKTPAPNVLIYFYHTDHEGLYGNMSRGETRHGHFRGWLLTDSKGRYEFFSIRPAPYPQRAFAAHIHMTITSKTLKEDSIDSILFEGDELISAEERRQAGKRGGFNPILKLEKYGDGIWCGTRDIKLWQA